MRLLFASALLAALAPATLLGQPLPDRTGASGNDLILLAQGQSQGKGQGQGQGPSPGQIQGQGPGGPQGGPPDNRNGQSRFRDDHRGIIVSYYQQQYYGRGACPPGLAKKNNGCLPPGQAKKLYGIGQPWPPHLAFQPLPGALLGRLGPPPPGYGYGYYSGDVIMYRHVGNIVVDIVATLGR